MKAYIILIYVTINIIYYFLFIEDPTLTPVQIAMIVLSILIVMILAIIITVLLVRKYCRKKYTVSNCLLFDHLD